MTARANVWFLSDYGTADECVGVVRAVIRAFAPEATVMDLTHQVHPYDVRGASLTLARSVQYLGAAVVLAVVDPGVGSARRAIAVEAGGAGEVGGVVESGSVEADGNSVFFVGPDNGLLAPAVAMVGGARRAVELNNPLHHLEAPGPTFAGRDIFAPAVARLCLGHDLDDLGERIDPLSLLPGLMPLADVGPDRIVAEVLWTDRFGNLQLNLDPGDLPGTWAGPGHPLTGDPLVVRTAAGTRSAARVRTYGDLQAGQVGVLIDSYGLVTLVCNRRSAATELALGAGDQVTFDLLHSPEPTSAGSSS